LLPENTAGRDVRHIMKPLLAFLVALALNSAPATEFIIFPPVVIPPVVILLPHAMDDEAFTAGRNAVTIDVLGNDLSLDVQITEVGRPTAGAVVVNPNGTITYSPSAAFEGVDTFTYRITLPEGGSDVATVTVRDTYAACTGTYNALVGTNLTRVANAGAITITATPLGSFTGVLQFAGDTLPLKGQLRFDGQAFLDLKNRRGQPITLNFAIDPGQGKLSGGVSFNGLTSQFEAGKVGYDSVQNFAPQAGRYTLLLPRNEPNVPSLRGDGFAIMTVSTAGAVVVMGRTGEGTVFSNKAFVGPDARFPLYAPMGPGRRSSLQGWVTFRNEADFSDCDGMIGLDKPFTLPISSSVSSSGVIIIVVGEPPAPIQTSLVGSRYITPAPGLLLLNWADHAANGSFETGSSESQIGILPITLTQKHKIRAAVPAPFSLKLDPKTGLFTGTVRLTLAARPKFGTFHGVLFQRQAIGGGVWKSGADVGWISIARVVELE
jgi:hypothetical protein